MRDVTLVLPYYDNAQMFTFQQSVWAAYPDDLKRRLHVIMVDDCSPTHPAQPRVVDVGLASFSLYRTLVDVRWNWIFCRNLAMSQTRTEWALMTDIDHVLPAPTLRTLVEQKFQPQYAYRLSRLDAPKLAPYKPHPNTWFLRRAVFDQIGGYDETFSGWYGTDGDFRRRLEQVAKIVLLPDVMIRYQRDTIVDASTTTYTRKESYDYENVRRIVAERKPGWTTKRLTFPYERVL